jgi:Arc/MetJ-type ribon-helix-helix transcriptional regulator
VRIPRDGAPGGRFLGVRLSAEEESLLETFRRARGHPNRSEAVRALVRGASEEPPAAGRLPTTLKDEIDELVEDGYAETAEGALALLVALGLAELARTHTERVPALREHARAVRERRAGRRRADREGRGLLGR